MSTNTAMAAGASAAPSRPSPNPIVSKGKAAVSEQGGAKSLNDGRYRGDSWQAGKPSPSKPSTVAFDIGKGPSKLLLSWTSSGSFNYQETTYGGPGSYFIETSADSTDGKNGTWKKAVNVTGNLWRTRAHSFDFSGQRWVRFSVAGPSPTTYEYGVQLDEMEIHDVSNGASDTWFFMGDSITAMAFDRDGSRSPSFAERIHALAPRFEPVMLNGGIGGEKVDDGLKHLDKWLELNPDMKYWAIGYGTNDSAGNNMQAGDFKKKMKQLAQRLMAKGKVPVFARIPWAPKDHDTVPAYNKAIDELTAELGLMKGPDLFAHFKANPGQLKDGLHPDDAGIIAINKLWAEAMAPLYTSKGN